EQVDPSVAAGQGASGAAWARPCWLRPGRFFRGESLAFIRGSSNPDLPIRLTVLPCLHAVPSDIDIARIIGRYGAAAIQPLCTLHQITFIFEGGTGVVEACVEHRASVTGPFRTLPRSVPDNMDASVLSECNLAAPNAAGRDRTRRPTIHPNWGRESLLAAHHP